VRIVIVGSGLAGVTLAEALAKGGRHEVTLATAETFGYYSRPRLSHGFALDEAAASRIVLKPFESLAGVEVLAGTEVWLIDRPRKRLIAGEDRALPYDVLVLATGSAARVPPALIPFQPQFATLNNLDDLLTLRHRRKRPLMRGKTPHWAVVGGGLIGCEIASDLHKAGDLVTIYHREKRLVELQLSETESRSLDAHFSARGIRVRYGQDLGRLPEPFDGVIVAAGFAPRVQLASEAGLPTARGIIVDGYLRTADPRIYAVGDVAQIGSQLYPFVTPIRSQALWLASHLDGQTQRGWAPPLFKPVIKVHDFKLAAEVL
jgi:NAD(P)H-nitrite reductase large subunit